MRSGENPANYDLETAHRDGNKSHKRVGKEAAVAEKVILGQTKPITSFINSNLTPRTKPNQSQNDAKKSFRTAWPLKNKANSEGQEDRKQ